MSEPSEPSEPRPGGEGRPAPAPAPPMEALNNQETLFRYFLRHEGEYTREALEQAAAAAGHTPDDIGAAWNRSQVGVEGQTSSNRFAIWARLIVLGLYLGTFVLFVAFSNMSERTYGVGVPILGVLLLVLGLVSLARVGQTKLVSKDPLLALTSILAVPFVLLVIVAGLCVLTTSPQFFSGAA